MQIHGKGEFSRRAKFWGQKKQNLWRPVCYFYAHHKESLSEEETIPPSCSRGLSYPNWPYPHDRPSFSTGQKARASKFHLGAFSPSCTILLWLTLSLSCKKPFVDVKLFPFSLKVAQEESISHSGNWGQPCLKNPLYWESVWVVNVLHSKHSLWEIWQLEEAGRLGSGRP